VLIRTPRGRTAILEVFRSRIVAREVLESLHSKWDLSIENSSIRTGSVIRGQSKEEFKTLIRDIEDDARLSVRVGVCHFWVC
jgi:ATP-dependent Clp protease ATP-binding subunit ClpA